MKLVCFTDHVPIQGEKVVVFFSEKVDGPEAMTRGELITAQIFLRQVRAALTWGWSRPEVKYKDLTPPPLESVTFFEVQRLVTLEGAKFSIKYQAVEFESEDQLQIIMRAINASDPTTHQELRHPQTGRDGG